VTVNSSPDTPLLWVLRDELGMVGTKFGCGKALCGACTVHLNGMAVRSCQTQIGAVAGQKVTTIEGLNNNAVQKAWVALDVPQCGYCQPGQIMSATALLASTRTLPMQISTASCLAISAVAVRIHAFAPRSKRQRKPKGD